MKPNVSFNMKTKVFRKIVVWILNSQNIKSNLSHFLSCSLKRHLAYSLTKKKTKIHTHTHTHRLRCMFFSLSLYPFASIITHWIEISDHSQVFVTEDKCIYIYTLKWTTDRSEAKRVRSQIERDTSDIRIHTFKSQQNTYTHFFFLYQMMINDKKSREATLFIQIWYRPTNENASRNNESDRSSKESNDEQHLKLKLFYRYI